MNNLPKDRVFAVQVTVLLVRDEELRLVGVKPTISHRYNTPHIVLSRDIQTCKTAASSNVPSAPA